METAVEHIVETKSVQLFSGSNPLRMECGRELSSVTVAYETYGELNAARDNAILVCHALTGSAHAAGFLSADPKSAGWWDSFIGEGKTLDTRKYFVICSNFLGGCYGTTGSISNDPATRKPYGLSFPQMTVRDMVHVQHALIEFLGVKALRTVIGGSLGGMQALEWSLCFPQLVRSIIPIATASQHSPWCIGLNGIARQAIMNDPKWRDGDYYDHGQPERGLSLARQVAMVSYRSDVSFSGRFHRDRIKSNGHGTAARFDVDNFFEVENYLRYQGEKLVDRFDANTYLYISRAMDLHDVAYERGKVEEVLSSVKIPALCVGIDSDILYPVHEQKALASHLPRSVYGEIDSPFGHDAFLIEFEQLGKIVTKFFRDFSLAE
ncbi:MAG TPA: homoserine O-acetyltransferase [Bacteroidota bacterium]|nr:homoserine O-acetyltransferase [Bacteroidota bacterium]